MCTLELWNERKSNPRIHLKTEEEKTSEETLEKEFKETFSILKQEHWTFACLILLHLKVLLLFNTYKYTYVHPCSAIHVERRDIYATPRLLFSVQFSKSSNGCHQK